MVCVCVCVLDCCGERSEVDANKNEADDEICKGCRKEGGELISESILVSQFRSSRSRDPERTPLCPPPRTQLMFALDVYIAATSVTVLALFSQNQFLLFPFLLTQPK